MPFAWLPWWKKSHGRPPKARCRRLHLEALERRIVFASDTLLTATPLSFSVLHTAQAAHFLATAGEVDLYRVALGAGDRLNAAVSAQTAGSGLVSLLRVFYASGTQVALDDQEGGDPQLTFQVAAAGDYYVGVSSAPNDNYDLQIAGGGTAGGTTGLYTLNLRDTPDAVPLEDLTGSSFRLGSDAAAWGDTLPVSFTIENRGAVAADSTAQAQLLLSDNNTFDSSAHLYAFAPTFSLAGLGPGQAYPSGTLTVSLPDLATAQALGFSPSGPVFVGVRITDDPTQDASSFDKSGGHRGEDGAALTIVTPSTVKGHNRTLATALPLNDLNSSVVATLGAAQAGWYVLSVTTPGQLAAVVTPAGSSTLVPELTLYGNRGQLLIQSDGPIPGASFAGLRQHLASGTYYLAVSAPTGTGSYELTTAFVPGQSPLEPVTVGSNPVSIALADLNDDGNLDMIVTNNGSNTISALLGNGDGTFQSQQTYRVGNGPNGVAVADLNGDNRPDLIVTNFSDNTISVLFGNGDGTFQAAEPFAVGSKPVAVAVADLTGDGNLDVVTANYGTDTVSVLLGTGNGAFQPQKTFPVGLNPQSVTVADVNGDGIPDLIVANRNSATVSVLLGSGNGSFHAQQTFTVGANPTSVAVADVNGDGKLDLLVTNGSDKTVSVLLGHGNGTFKLQQTFAVGGDPDQVAAADVNGDGSSDLVIANYKDDTVSVLLGNGDGTFQPQQTFSAGSGPRAVALGDFNSDGRVDLAVTDFGTSTHGNNTVSVLFGNGDGSFQAAPGLRVGARPRSVAVADLNGDGKPDVITGNYGTDTVSVLIGNGDGSFQPQQTLTVGAKPAAVAVADLNGDGRPDIVVAHYGANTISVLLGDGDGSFQPQRTFPVGKGPESVTVKDVNGDGKPDLIVANYADNTVSVLLGNGDGSFQPQDTFAVGKGPFSVAVADVNRNGKPDIVVANLKDNTVSILLGNGDGTFQPQRTFNVGSAPRSVAVADLNGDGKPDIVVANRGTSVVSVLLGNGDGTFQPQSGFSVGSDPRSVVIADVNGDGKPDLIVANYGDNTVSVLLGDGKSSFQNQQTFNVGAGPIAVAVADVNTDGHLDIITANYGDDTASALFAGGQGFSFQNHFTSVGASPDAVATGDVNGDGKPDLIVANYDANTVSVLLGNGNGTFQNQQTFEVGSGPEAVIFTDVNGDGIPDIVTANYGDNTISVLLGNGNGTFSPDPFSSPRLRPGTFAVGTNPSSVAVADVNGDGIPDLIIANYYYSAKAVSTVSVLIGIGHGDFQAQQTFDVGNQPRSIAVTDVNGDGKPDIVTANLYDNTVSVLLNVTPAGSATVGMSAQPPVSVGSSPQSVAVADLNGDGKPDIVAANYDNDNVSVLLGNGDGTFQKQQTFAAGPSPYAVVVTDLNGDGIPDIVTANNAGATVSVLLGNGNGTFQAQKIFNVGSQPQGLLVADLNGDGHPDLVTANLANGDASLLLGNGDGTFQSQKTFSVRAQPTSVTVADINGDGLPDLIAADRGVNTVNLLLGNGDGTFQTQQTFSVGAGPKSVAVADLNGDGKPDIVTANYDAGTVSVLLGNAGGSFQAQRTFAVGPRPESVAVADFNGDGILDIVVANYGDGTVSVLLGNGDGTFQTQQTFAVGPKPASLYVADLNSDGKPDVVAANYGGNTVSVLLNAATRGSSSARFAPELHVNVGLKPIAVTVADLNGDGKPDIVAANYANSTVSVLLGNGDGTFQSQQTVVVGSKPKSVAVADVSGDGTPDLITANYGTNSVSVLVGNDDGTFQPQQTFAVSAEPKSVAVADVNGDRRPDIVTANYGDDTLSVLLNVKGNAFLPASASGNGIANTPLLTDLNGDHIPDSVILNNAGDILFRRGLPGKANQFASPTTLQGSLGIDRPARDLTVVNIGTGSAIAAADANFDHATGAYTVSLYTVAANGSVTRSTAFSTPFLPTGIAAADLTGNGLDDIVVANALNDSVEVAFQIAAAPGHFTAPVTFPVGLTPSAIALVDVVDANGVGLPDIVVGDQSSGAVTVLVNNSTLPFAQAESFNAGIGSSGVAPGTAGPVVNSLDQSVSLASGDFTGDGGNDLVVVNRGAHSFTLLPNDGNGGFSDPLAALTTSTSNGLTINNQPGPIVVGYFHGLNHPLDLAILMEGLGQVWVFTNNGDGTFTLGPQIPVGGTATGLSVVPGSGPGRVDLLVGDSFGDILRLVGNGDGTFAPPPSLTGDSVPLDVRDLKGTVPAVLVADQATNTITVQTPTGKGATVGPVQTLVDPSSHLAPGAVQWAKLDGSTGLFDAVVVASGSNSVLVYHTTSVDPVTGNPTFAPPASYAVGTDPVAVTIQDINDNGIPDMVVANKGSNDISVLFGSIVDGIWTSTPGPRLSADGIGPIGTTLQDVNGDGIPDLVVTNSGSANVSVLPGIGSNGKGTGFYQDNNPLSSITVPGNPIGPMVDGFVPTTHGIVTVNDNTGASALVFASTDLTAFSAGTNGEFVAGFGDGSVALFAQAAAGSLAESLIFRDAGLTDPSALEMVDNNGQSEIYATSAGENRVFVFALSDGIPVPNSSSQPDTPSPSIIVEPLNASGISLVPSFITGSQIVPTVGVADRGTGFDAEGFGVGGLLQQASLVALLADDGEENGVLASADTSSEITPTALSPDSASRLHDFIIGVDDAVRSIREQIRQQRRNRDVEGGGTDGPVMPAPEATEPLSALDPPLHGLPEKWQRSATPGSLVFQTPHASARRIADAVPDGPHQEVRTVAVTSSEQLAIDDNANQDALTPVCVADARPFLAIWPDAADLSDEAVAMVRRPSRPIANAPAAAKVFGGTEWQTWKQPLLVALFVGGIWHWSIAANDQERTQKMPPIAR